MDRIKIIIVCLICNLTFIYAQAQHNEIALTIDSLCCDTIFCDGWSLSVKVPYILYRHKSFYQYDEGFYMTYSYKDSAYFFIHKGYNVTHPICDTTQIKSYFENDTLKCYYGTYNTIFFKEIFYKERKVTISYVNIKEEDVLLFNYIISTLRFFPYSLKAEMSD